MVTAGINGRDEGSAEQDDSGISDGLPGCLKLDGLSDGCTKRLGNRGAIDRRTKADKSFKVQAPDIAFREEMGLEDAMEKRCR